jgi:hypothetical protein
VQAIALLTYTVADCLLQGTVTYILSPVTPTGNEAREYNMSKSPSQYIEEALEKLPSVQLFASEQAARQWTEQLALGLLRHKLELAQLDPQERERADPIEAGYVHAKDLGTRPRRQRIGWIDSLLDAVADACFCEVVPLSGTMSSWLIGRHTDRLTVMKLLGSLVPTAEKLGQDAYLNEYHTQRKAGDVEAARGFKDGWLSEYVQGVKSAFQSQLEKLPQMDQLRLADAKLEVVGYMNENFLPTRGNRTERLRPLR